MAAAARPAVDDAVARERRGHELRVVEVDLALGGCLPLLMMMVIAHVEQLDLVRRLLRGSFIDEHVPLVLHCRAEVVALCVLVVCA